MFLYIPVKEYRHMSDVGDYISFGIAMLEHTESGWKRGMLISDISTDGDAVAALTRRCNAGHLHPIHLLDVVADFLG